MAKIRPEKSVMLDRWFLVWNKEKKLWQRVDITYNRSHLDREFEFEAPDGEHITLFALRLNDVAFEDIEKKFKLRLLHNYHWWTYPVGKWKFRGYNWRMGY